MEAHVCHNLREEEEEEEQQQQQTGLSLDWLGKHHEDKRETTLFLLTLLVK